ncbi:hypothetical protein BH11PAT4_BH11PAT4_5130 [soil metagenome]
MQKLLTYPILLRVGCGVLVALIASLVATTFVAYNSDSAAGVLMASDMLKGNVLLDGWQIPADNFLATDVVWFVPLVAIFGATPKVLAIGAGVQAGLLTLVLLWLTTQGMVGRKRKLALAVAAVFLAPSTFFILSALEIPAHGSTAIFGLLSAVLALTALKRGNVTWFTGVGLVLVGVLAVFSDLFSLALSVAPILLTATLLRLRKQVAPRLALHLALTQVLAVALAFVAVRVLATYGAQFIHQPFSFDTLPGVLANLQLYVSLFLSSYGANFFGLPIADTTLLVLLSLLKVAVVVLVIRSVWVRVSTRGVKLDPETLLLFTPFVLGSVAFIFSAYPDGLGSIRYLLPCMFFLIPLVGRYVASQKCTNTQEYVAYGACILSLLITTGQLIRSVKPGNTPAELASILEANGVTRAYGTYWAGTATSLYSGGTVEVVPVKAVGESVQPYYWLSSSSWYSSPTYSLVTTLKDGEGLQAAVVSKLGAPVYTYATSAYTVATWNHDITPVLEHYENLE